MKAISVAKPYMLTSTKPISAHYLNSYLCYLFQRLRVRTNPLFSLMATQLIEAHRENAEVYTGEICRSKCLELLKELDLPNGCLPLQDMLEVGYNRETGFVWMKQKKAVIHFFKKTNKYVSYGQEMTAFVEKHRMKKLTGVKSKELLIWVTIGDIYIPDSDLEKIYFKNPTTGISKSFPVSVFVDDE